jgi:hypothetical protein
LKWCNRPRKSASAWPSIAWGKKEM